MKRKILILHEIYGVNQFIKEQAQTYYDEHTSVSCISLYPERKSFPYKQEQQAYDFFYVQSASMHLLRYYHKNY